MSASDSHTRTKRVYQPTTDTKALRFPSGTRFGRLLAIENLGVFKRCTFYRCVCDCGQVTEVRGTLLLRGITKSCGCLSRGFASARRIHGQAVFRDGKRPSEYNVYATMKARCHSPNCKSYASYGAKGITVCDRWRYGEDGKSGFECFFADMGTRPSSGHTIERQSNALGYSPSNCVWATRKQQARNMSRNLPITIDGTTRLLVEWAEVSGIASGTLQRRYANGWPLEALLKPVNFYKNKGPKPQ